MTSETDADFDRLSWHDCALWGLEFAAGDADDSISDLALDIDFITTWSCGVDGRAEFHVAPAALVFHGVTDLEIDLRWRPAGFQVALHPLSIARIERERILDARVYLDRPYFRYRIALNGPDLGAITFGAVAFSQTLRASPIRTPEQTLSRRTRLALIRGD